MVLLNSTHCYSAQAPIKEEETVPAAPAKPQLDLFATVSRAVQNATDLPSPIAKLAADYRGDFVRRDLRRAWTAALPTHYLDALVKPLSDGTIVAFSPNGEFTIFNMPTGRIDKDKSSLFDKVNCIEVLPDDTILIGSEDGSIHGLNVKNGGICCPFALAKSIDGIAYVQSDKGEEELFVATKDYCFTVDSNTWEATQCWPIKNGKTLTRLSKSKIGFTGTYVSDSARQEAIVYNSNLNKQDSCPLGGLGITMLNSNNALIAQCGEKLALAHAYESTTVSFWELLDDGRRLTDQRLLERQFDLNVQDLEHPATITSLEDAIAVNDNGTVHIVDGGAQRLQTLPDDNIHKTFSDGKNGLITIRRGKGLLSKRTAIIAAWKPLTFEQQEIASAIAAESIKG